MTNLKTMDSVQNHSHACNIIRNIFMKWLWSVTRYCPHSLAAETENKPGNFTITSNWTAIHFTFFWTKVWKVTSPPNCLVVSQSIHYSHVLHFVPLIARSLLKNLRYLVRQLSHFNKKSYPSNVILWTNSYSELFIFNYYLF